MHKVLVNRLGGLSLPRKSVVRLTDHPDMTLDVYCGRKTTIQQQQLNLLSYWGFKIGENLFYSQVNTVLYENQFFVIPAAKRLLHFISLQALIFVLRSVCMHAFFFLTKSL